MKRSYIGPSSYEDALAALKARQAKHPYQGQRRVKLGPKDKPRLGLKRNGVRLKPGRRMKEWASVWRWLKPRLEAASRVRCEFDWPEVAHECSNVLTPAHSKKRRLMIGMDIYAVAIACSTVHTLLDEKMSHAEMEAAVLKAIERSGGLILPEKERRAA